ncbi:MAG: sulfurtransferase-like selenium metabolism protein YedF [Desulfobacteraceae bacterium]|jgi:selenium metabolism protein YedF
MTAIDCRGLACPAPVLKTKDAIEKNGLTEIAIMVDNEAAKQNVARFLESRNFNISIRDEEDFFIVFGKSADAVDEENIQSTKDSDSENESQKIMVMVTSDKIGHGDDELGTKLMASFLKTLREMGSDLWRLVFLNEGVKLTIDGSEALEDIKDLEKNSIKILVCGTCLTHFNLLERKQAGETTNMLDIVTAMQLADKVINV